MLHDAGDEHIPAVGDDVDLKLRAGHIFVHQHGVFNAAGEYSAHIFLGLGAVSGYGHVLAADNIRRAQEHGIAELIGSLERLLKRPYTHTARTEDAEALKELVKALPILCDIYALGGGAEDPDSVFVKNLRELYRRLAAEGYHDPHGLFDLDDVHDVLGG